LSKTILISNGLVGIIGISNSQHALSALATVQREVLGKGGGRIQIIYSISALASYAVRLDGVVMKALEALQLPMEREKSSASSQHSTCLARSKSEGAGAASGRISFLA
jgi:hypothetical protein